MTAYQLPPDWPCKERCPEQILWPEPAPCGAPATRDLTWEDGCTWLTCTQNHRWAMDTAEIVTRHGPPVDTDGDKLTRVRSLLDDPALDWTAAQRDALTHALATPDGCR